MPSRLKLIELHGFKTFATKTDFEFSNTVTAIVGPNGSGKSNIADAIRWVLGEQTYSLMRAKRTEDMIFSGSEQRSRSGMASVNIVFENSDGWLPIDFSEVSITRRAYRDGQNEYLINGQRVRLRDVTELLSQSGLAERTYTIIGQGLVDAALALKAEERRRLFEEAAGIGLHRSRREEALRRLSTTQRNLERVLDILAELRPRLRSLERHAKRVQDYDRIKADLQILLRDWYGFHWHRAQREFADAQEVSRTQDESLQKVRSVQEDLDRRLNITVQEIQSHRDRLSDSHRILSELHARREQMNRELAITEERLRSISNQETITSQEISRLDQELGYQTELASLAKADIERLSVELDEAAERCGTVRTALDERQSAQKNAALAVQQVEQTIGKLTGQKSHLVTRLSEREALVAYQREQANETRLSLEQTRQEIEDLSEKLVFANKDAAEISKALDQQETILQAAIQNIDTLETERRKILDSRAEIITNQSRMVAQLEVIEQAERSFTGYAEGAKMLLEAAEADARGFSVDTFTSKIQVSPQYDQAITAALGEFFDIVLLDRKARLDKVLEILENGSVRSAVLPLDDVHYSAPIVEESIKNKPGFVGIAFDLIKVPGTFERAARLLLGDVIVIESREYAQEWIDFLVSNDLASRCLVTLQGELFLTGGQVVAGKETKSGLLNRPRQRSNLKSKLLEIQRQMDQLQNAIDNVERKINAAREQEAEDRLEHQRLSSSAEKHQDIVDKIESDLSAKQGQARFLDQRLEQLSSQIAQNVPDIEKMKVDIRAIDTQIDENHANLRDKKAILADLSLDEQQTELAHWQTRLAVAQKSREDVQKRLDELNSVIERAENSRQLLKSQILKARQQSEQLMEKKQATSSKERELEEEIEAAQTKINPIESALNVQEKDYRELQRLESETRQALTRAEHQYAQARITLARRQEGLESLQRRIEDDFGLVEYRYDDQVSGPTPLPLDGFVEQLPAIVEIPRDLEENVKRLRAQLRRIGPVNPEMQDEYVQVKERYEFLTEQTADLNQAQDDLKDVIAELDLLMEREFLHTFEAVAQEFRKIFSRLFGGGTARLVLTTPEDLTESGIEIEARLPGRREQGLSLLSGGERSLTAAALVFSLLRVSPTPFCVLDEVDAMLDEANVGRYRDLLRELSEQTQFVIITHNRNTVQAANVIYGITMGVDSTSQMISLRLDNVNEVLS